MINNLHTAKMNLVLMLFLEVYLIIIVLKKLMIQLVILMIHLMLLIQNLNMQYKHYIIILKCTNKLVLYILQLIINWKQI